MKEWRLLKDLPIEKAGTIITVAKDDYIVKETGQPFPYSPVTLGPWFEEVAENDWFTYLSAPDTISFMQRISDQEKFRAGDETNHGIISHFTLCGDIVDVYFKSEGSMTAYDISRIKNLHKIQKPLFVSMDNVQIKYGDVIYGVAVQATCHDYLREWRLRAPYTTAPSNRVWFKSKVNAINYYLHHKPLFCIEELNMLTISNQFDMSQLRRIARSKMGLFNNNLP